MSRFSQKNRHSDLKPLGGQDITLLAVKVVDESDIGASVRIVFDRGDFSDDAVLIALSEVDDPVLAFHSAGLMPDCDLALIVAAGTFFATLSGFFRFGFRDLRIINLVIPMKTVGTWFVFDDGH